MSFDGYLFDCDGSVVKNAELIHGKSVKLTLQDIFRKAGLDLPDDYFENTWVEQLGKGIANFYDTFAGGLDTAHQALVHQFSGHAAGFEQQYEQHYCDWARSGEAGLIVRKGLGSIVTMANDTNAPFAIISNAKQAVLNATVESSKIEGQIALVAGKDTVEAAGYKAKPEAGSYLYGCDTLGLDPARCLGLEDNVSGLTSLVRAGVGTIIFCQNDLSQPVPELATQHAAAIIGPDDCLEETVLKLTEPRRTVHPVRVPLADNDAIPEVRGGSPMLAGALARSPS